MGATLPQHLPATAIPQESVHFWEWLNDGLVKITLKRNQSLSWGFRRPDEEGFSYESREWHFDGHKVEVVICSGGRDCDGRIDHFGRWEAYYDELCRRPAYLGNNTYSKDIFLPEWTELKLETYDHEAIKAGY